jgi:hypothetical protein
VRTVQISKVKSDFTNNGKTLVKSKSNALKPFPTVDPEFYQETAPNFFWQKELTKIASEKSIMNRTSQSLNNKSKIEGNKKNFYSVIVQINIVRNI